MKTLTFRGTIGTGVGKHVNLVIPGSSDLADAPVDWPERLQPGSLNIRIHAGGYPAEFSQVPPVKKVKHLDSKQFPPAFTIPHDQMSGNTLTPREDMPEKGTAQVWRAVLRINASSVSRSTWVLRRIGSRVGEQLELVSDNQLRTALSLADGMEVTVEMEYQNR